MFQVVIVSSSELKKKKNEEEKIIFFTMAKMKLWQVSNVALANCYFNRRLSKWISLLETFFPLPTCGGGIKNKYNEMIFVLTVDKEEQMQVGLQQTFSVKSMRLISGYMLKYLNFLPLTSVNIKFHRSGK